MRAYVGDYWKPQKGSSMSNCDVNLMHAIIFLCCKYVHVHVYCTSAVMYVQVVLCPVCTNKYVL